MRQQRVVAELVRGQIPHLTVKLLPFVRQEFDKDRHSQMNVFPTAYQVRIGYALTFPAARSLRLSNSFCLALADRNLAMMGRVLPGSARPRRWHLSKLSVSWSPAALPTSTTRLEYGVAKHGWLYSKLPQNYNTQTFMVTNDQ